MKCNYGVKAVLITSGILAIFIGGSILVDPISFHAQSGLKLGSDASLWSEIRATGGALLGLGVVIFLGSLIKTLEFTAMLVMAAK